MKRIALFSALVAASLFGASAALACDGDKTETTASAEVPANAQLVTLVVNDATCGSCVVPIREQVTALNGVIDVKGSEENFQWIHVTVTEGKVSTDQLIAAVKKAGYSATVKAAEAPAKS
ncbi:MAG: heavy-metal-associated domain-containing protein [Deltaproteobacteria bacterium]|nr:heavy-metal-associated domain-containing protein [Deltaproteobacteria bacterium]